MAQQGRAGKTRGPVQNLKIGPYFTKFFEICNNYNNMYIYHNVLIAIGLLKIIPSKLPGAQCLFEHQFFRVI
jgi:hypothetical protein